jgi:hypothetical protein
MIKHRMEKGMPEFKFEIKKHFGVLSEGKGGWQTELNLVSWGGHEAKYDIRDWSADHTKMSKGVTLSEEEMLVLKEIIEEIF